MTEMPSPYFRKQIFLPQDHGSWVFIFSPLLIGLFAGGRFTLASLSLVTAALAAFLSRQPVSMAVKAFAGRRARSDLPAARFWIVVYGVIAAGSLLSLWRAGFGYLLALAMPGAAVFGWHLWLVSRREERRQVNVEIIATGVLSLAAPAAYWVGMGRYDARGWWLWILVWLQTAASIVYAYLRLEQRSLADLPPRAEMWRLGIRSLLYTTFNVLFVLALGLVSVLPGFLFLPFLVQWSETLWGILHPAIKWKPTRIGVRQLLVSTLWTILFIVTWQMGL